MTDRLRAASAALALALVVIVGLILATVAGQPPATGPTPTMAGLATPSLALPSPPLATATPDRPGPTPPSPPAGSPTSTAVPVPTASPTPTPIVTPAAPVREVTFAGLGLDSQGGGPEGEETTPRYFTFRADGPGRIQAELSDVSFGRVRACLWRGDPRLVRGLRCETLRRGSLERELGTAGTREWTLSLIGADPGASPSVTLRLSFPTSQASIRLEGFRFQGTAIDNYNGFTAVIRTSTAGSLTVEAAFDDGEGGAHPYRLLVEEISGGPAHALVEEGEGHQLQVATDVIAERSYRVALENRDAIADQRILLSGRLDWP